MSHRQRLVVFGIGVVAMVLLFVPALRHLPTFGDTFHPLRDLAVKGAVAHQTSNAVSSVNYDQRATDTLGEELILLASVAGTAALLRTTKREHEKATYATGHVLSPVRLLTYVLLPVTVLIGADVVVHGQVTPGGGFQGGVVLATGLHLLYVGGTYEALERLRPIEAFDLTEAFGAAAFVSTGLATLLAGSAFLANELPFGTFASLLSGGTVAVLSIAVGLEVAGGVVVLLAEFLRQALTIRQAG